MDHHLVWNSQYRYHCWCFALAITHRSPTQPSFEQNDIAGNGYHVHPIFIDYLILITRNSIHMVMGTLKLGVVYRPRDQYTDT